MSFIKPFSHYVFKQNRINRVCRPFAFQSPHRCVSVFLHGRTVAHTEETRHILNHTVCLYLFTMIYYALTIKFSTRSIEPLVSYIENLLTVRWLHFSDFSLITTMLTIKNTIDCSSSLRKKNHQSITLNAMLQWTTVKRVCYFKPRTIESLLQSTI